MKAVVGVDVAGLYEAAINLLGRLEFPSVDLDLIHVDVPAALTTPEAFVWTPEVLQIQNDIDNRTLLGAKEAATRQGLKVHKTDKLIGSPSGVLLSYADETHADLVVIGSTEKSRFGSFLFGSVGRALAIGSRESFLIAKGPVAKEGNLRVVFATDHSKYADDALNLLIKLQPAGIEKLTLLTVINSNLVDAATDAFESYLSAKSDHSVRHLRGAGICADYKVVRGEFAEEIDKLMKVSGTNLLIMGAQGHGFLDRLLIGSVTLHQVVATNHSILVLRPGKAT